MSFGQHLRRLREGAGLSRAELARRAGVPASTLRGWEGDRGFPALPAALRLAGALGVPVERFAEGWKTPGRRNRQCRRSPAGAGRTRRTDGGSVRQAVAGFTPPPRPYARALLTTRSRRTAC